MILRNTQKSIWIKNEKSSKKHVEFPDCTKITLKTVLPIKQRKTKSTMEWARFGNKCPFLLKWNRKWSIACRFYSPSIILNNWFNLTKIFHDDTGVQFVMCEDTRHERREERERERERRDEGKNRKLINLFRVQIIYRCEYNIFQIDFNAIEEFQRQLQQWQYRVEKKISTDSYVTAWQFGLFYLLRTRMHLFTKLTGKTCLRHLNLMINNSCIQFTMFKSWHVANIVFRCTEYMCL